MIEAMKKQNIDYAVIDGFPIPQSKVKVITLSLETFDVVLATDGYPVLRPSLHESEAALKQQLWRRPSLHSTIQGHQGMDGRQPLLHCARRFCRRDHTSQSKSNNNKT